MNLYLATVLFSLLCFAFGVGFFFKAFEPYAKGFLRSKKAANILASVALLWFVWILYNLQERDFGQYKMWLILLFGGAGVLTFKFLPDFLSVRALCVIVILFCRECVDSAFMHWEQPSRLVMVSLAYVFVVCCVYFGCLPYRLRDSFDWLFENSSRPKIFASIMCACGAATLVSMLFY